MRILVLGGTRFTGYKVVCLLAAEGHSIDVISKKAVLFEFKNVRFFLGEKSEVISQHNLFSKRYDFVIDFTCYKQKDAQLLLTLNVPNLLVISSLWVTLFDSNVIRPWSENEIKYLNNKKIAEVELINHHGRVSVIRLPVIAGAHDHTGRFQESIHQAERRRLFNGFDTNEPLFVLDVDSVAEFITKNIQASNDLSYSLINLCPQQVETRQAYLDVIESLSNGQNSVFESRLNISKQKEHAYVNESFDLNSFSGAEYRRLEFVRTSFNIWVSTQVQNLRMFQYG